MRQKGVCCVARSAPPSQFMMSVRSTIVLNVLTPTLVGPMLFVKYTMSCSAALARLPPPLPATQHMATWVEGQPPLTAVAEVVVQAVSLRPIAEAVVLAGLAAEAAAAAAGVDPPPPAVIAAVPAARAADAAGSTNPVAGAFGVAVYASAGAGHAVLAAGVAGRAVPADLAAEAVVCAAVGAEPAAPARGAARLAAPAMCLRAPGQAAGLGVTIHMLHTYYITILRRFCQAMVVRQCMHGANAAIATATCGAPPALPRVAFRGRGGQLGRLDACGGAERGLAAVTCGPSPLVHVGGGVEAHPAPPPPPTPPPAPAPSST